MRTESKLHRICFASHRREETDLPQLIVQSHTNNLRDGITGVLLCCGERYLQFFEGPSLPMLACFDRICIDQRHSDMRVLLNESGGERLFSHWHLSLLPIDRLPAQAINDFFLQVEEGEQRGLGTTAMDLLLHAAYQGRY